MTHPHQPLPFAVSINGTELRTYDDDTGAMQCLIYNAHDDDTPDYEAGFDSYYADDTGYRAAGAYHHAH